MEKLVTEVASSGGAAAVFRQVGCKALGGGLSGAFAGVFQVLRPGPPYLLHEKDYEGIELAAVSQQSAQYLEQQ